MILKTTELEKVYGGDFRLGPVSLRLAPGETVAFLGKNGSGKTTLFQLLTGNLDATKGTVHLQDQRLTPDTPEQKRRIGYLPQHHHLPRWVTGEDILGYAARLYALDQPQQRVEDAMDYWDCAFYRRRPLAACSHGMQKRIGLALATLHDPICLILDEPFTGLDLFHIRALDQAIKRRAKAGKTTILSTHIAPYTARICDRVYLVQSGHISTLEPWSERSYLERIDLIEAAFFGDAGGST